MNKKANYSFDVLIGEGGFARIFLCTYIPTGERVVIKQISRIPRSSPPSTFSTSNSYPTSLGSYSRMIDRDAVNEIMALSKLRNTEGVVHMYSYFKDSSNYYIVMEYIDGDDLNNYTISNYRKYLQRMGHIHKGECVDEHVAPLSENSARRLFANIIRAVQSIHRKQIVHLDLKLENIMINKQNEVKIIDFGLCELLDNPWTKLVPHASSPSLVSAPSPVKLTKYVGSVDYAAPEVLHKKPYDGYLADTWNLGVVLYILLQAKYPFQHPRLSHSLHFEDQLPLDDRDDEVLNVNRSRCLSNEARDLLQRMLTQEADKRLTVDEVLSHPWFSQAPISH